jgi:hypothetical protein
MLPSTRLHSLLLRGSDHPVLRAISVAWAALTAINITVWAMVAAIGGHVDRPWFLWATVPTGLALWAAWWLNMPARVGSE